jgi:mRNA interferase MazF
LGVKRGEVWTVAGGGDFTGKARPAVIVQDDQFADLDSICICGFTTDDTDLPRFRILIEPDPANGLERPSRAMVDKLTTVRRSRLTTRVGELSNADMVRISRALLIFLGLAAPGRLRRPPTP